MIGCQDQHHSPAMGRACHYVTQLLFGIDRAVSAISIGRLCDEHVRSSGRLRCAHERVVGSAEVAEEGEGSA